MNIEKLYLIYHTGLIPWYQVKNGSRYVNRRGLVLTKEYDKNMDKYYGKVLCKVLHK